MTLPYHHSLRPYATKSPTPGALDDCFGTNCPVCDTSLLVTTAPLTEEPDGSATFNCPTCNATLRANPQCYVFLDQREGVPA